MARNQEEERKEMTTGVKNDIIRKSHERSRIFGIQKKQTASRKILGDEELQQLLQSENELRTIAKPIINDFYRLLESTGFIIILTDDDGCVLDVMGDEDTVDRAGKSNIFPGACLNEENIGTNAMGTAIKENAPVQVSAREHFIQAFHVWTCSAAPIHDPDGKLIGTLNFTADKDKVHPHTLGLVVAAVRAIENSLKNNRINSLLAESQQQAFGIMNHLTFGVMTLSNEGLIEWINDYACIKFNIKRSLLINQPIDKFLDNWEELSGELHEMGKILDTEVHFTNTATKEAYNLSGFNVKSLEGKTTGTVITFREMERIIRLVNKYTGMEARFTFSDIIGKSKSISEVIDYAKTVSESPSTVLIEGDSGTGKEVFAQAIHNASSRSNYGFVALNCGAIAPNLIESELFGYDHGAFTGAKKGGHPGKFELANHGTLFLDEIGEMPMDMQVRLLRAIQEGSFTRVGGEKPIRVDVRIIAATNKNLKEEIDKGNFRLDLYYRLSVIPLRIPSLAERREDIMPLVKYFLRKKSLKLKKRIPDLSDETRRILMEYSWPGNIRELENFIEKTVLLDGKIAFDPIRKSVYNTEPEESKAEHFLEFSSKDQLPDLDEIEKKAILSYLDIFKNNVSRVAKTLNISRNTLYLKMKKYGIPY